IAVADIAGDDLARPQRDELVVRPGRRAEAAHAHSHRRQLRDDLSRDVSAGGRDQNGPPFDRSVHAHEAALAAASAVCARSESMYSWNSTILPARARRKKT